ncbi:MAG: hypothetical protein AB8B59_15495 [Maribacter sp.]
MKKSTLAFLCTCFCFLFAISAIAQNSEKKTESSKTIDDEEGPIMFKFEPDFVSKNEKRKTEIAITRRIIDTLNVSDRKRIKLLRDLYKNGVSKRLQKALLVENTFEDNENLE